MIRRIVVLVVNLNSVLVSQDLQDLQDLQHFAAREITMQYVQKVFAVVTMVNVILVLPIVLTRSNVRGVLEIVILPQHQPVPQPLMILVQYLEVFLIVRISANVYLRMLLPSHTTMVH